MANYMRESTTSTREPAHASSHQGDERRAHPGRRVTRETKPSFMSTEFWIYLASVAGVIIASYAVGTEDGHQDYFRADKAWLYVVILSVGYLLARGLAKSGSADHPLDDRDR